MVFTSSILAVSYVVNKNYLPQLPGLWIILLVLIIAPLLWGIKKFRQAKFYKATGATRFQDAPVRIKIMQEGFSWTLRHSTVEVKWAGVDHILEMNGESFRLASSKKQKRGDGGLAQKENEREK